MKCPVEFHTTSPRPFGGLPEFGDPFHDSDILVTNCGRLCRHRKKINISAVLAGQRNQRGRRRHLARQLHAL